MVGARIYMGIDHSKREVWDVLGFARIRDLSNSANQEMPTGFNRSLRILLKYSSSNFSMSWESLAKDAIELLPGVGNKKAMEMVSISGRVGWDSFTQLNEDCNINAAELLREIRVRD